MTHRMLLLLLLLPFSVSSAAPDAARMFRDATVAYERGGFRDAAAMFEQLLKEGPPSAALHYNLGNAYFKSGELAKAILQYERGRLLDPADIRLRENLEIANARIRDEVDPIPLLFLVRWWNTLKDAHTPSGLMEFSSILLWLLGAAMFVFFGIERLVLRRIALVSGALLAVLFAASILLYFDRVEDLEARRMAILLQREAVVRSTPDASGIESFTIHEGVKVEIREQRRSWARIVLADGTEGWIDGRAIERI